MPELFLDLMSGTSVDGVDAALVDLSSAQPDVLYAHTYAWPAALRERILAILQDHTVFQCNSWTNWMPQTCNAPWSNFRR
ncbi:MAG: anhydro-N-acetylmuramic acid kinase [Gammaproteobacteria bacterium]|nr:MAG: anhydro-N-acetylmuramic acid kinase [Gammaproteobacteria bacterium]